MCSIMGYCGPVLDLEAFQAGFQRTVSRGPDDSRIVDTGKGLLGFHRLSIMGLTSAGMQPFALRTFAIGMSGDAIDLKYAREVAEYIGSRHTEVIITREDVISNLERVIHLLGTYDITTIRASVGMYLVCKAIHEQTDIRVLLTGEISDELFGYKYTDYAPSAQAFQEESEKRVRELHMYDVLRADRCISVNSLEARVPFGDLEFVRYVMSVDPERKRNRYGKGKYLLRHAFEEGGWLPQDILWREKAAFSDAVGHSLVDDLKEYAEQCYTDDDFQKLRQKYVHARPFTKESLLYREIFEKYYPGQSGMVLDFWMPNREWEGCDVDDPSARVIEGVDTRALTKLLRSQGSMNAMLTCAQQFDVGQVLERLHAYKVRDTIQKVTRSAPEEFPAIGEERYHVAMMDYGVKQNMIDCLRRRGCSVTALPASTPAETVLSGVQRPWGPGGEHRHDPGDKKAL